MVALLATAAAILTIPRAYSYPKVLMLALGVAALRFAISRPSALALGRRRSSRSRHGSVRHDCGVYIAAGMIAGLIGLGGEARTVLGVVSGCIRGSPHCALLPSAIWVQATRGFRRTFEAP